MRCASRDQRGQSVSMYVIIMTFPLLLVAGLAYDGSRFLATQRRANDVAQQAARAGAQAVALDSYYVGTELTVDPSAAAAAADAYLGTRGYSGSTSVSGATVTVSVALSQSTAILGLVGIGSRTFTGTGSATAVEGIEGPGG